MQIRISTEAQGRTVRGDAAQYVETGVCLMRVGDLTEKTWQLLLNFPLACKCPLMGYVTRIETRLPAAVDKYGCPFTGHAD
jgi:hypothetical protein